MSGIADVLALDTIGTDLFRGPAIESEIERTFGGQVAAQAFTAAQQTVSGLVANSLHGYFIGPGDAASPIEFAVEHLRDGRSFATRQVRARQHGSVIFVLTVSFHRSDDDGPSHQDAAPQVPSPDEILAAGGGKPASSRLLLKEWEDWDIRLLPGSGREETSPDASASGYRYIWFRNTGKLPEDPDFHQGALAYMSDMTLLYSALIKHPGAKVQMASLDHAMWFHRPLKVDEWMLYEQHSPTADNGVALTSGRVWSAEGELLATVMQEGLLRTFKEKFKPRHSGGR